MCVVLFEDGNVAAVWLLFVSFWKTHAMETHNGMKHVHCAVEPLTNDHPHQRPSLGQWFLFVYESLTSDHPSYTTTPMWFWGWSYKRGSTVLAKAIKSWYFQLQLIYIRFTGVCVHYICECVGLHHVYRLFLHLLTSCLHVIIETVLTPKYNNCSFKIPVKDQFFHTNKWYVHVSWNIKSLTKPIGKIPFNV